MSCLLELAASRRNKTRAEKALLYQKVGVREAHTKHSRSVAEENIN